MTNIVFNQSQVKVVSCGGGDGADGEGTSASEAKSGLKVDPNFKSRVAQVGDGSKSAASEESPDLLYSSLPSPGYGVLNNIVRLEPEYQGLIGNAIFTFRRCHCNQILTQKMPLLIPLR